MPRAKLIHGSPDEIEAAYYDALGRADLEALMALWADDEEIICIHRVHEGWSGMLPSAPHGKTSCRAAACTSRRASSMRRTT